MKKSLLNKSSVLSKEEAYENIEYTPMSTGVNSSSPQESNNENSAVFEKNIDSLETVLKDLKCRNLINTEDEIFLFESFGKNEELIQRLFNKSKRNTTKRKYSASIRPFCITLHYCSPKGYSYVRKKFNKSLPHPKKLSKWYTSVDAQPGFSQEALELLKMKAEISDVPILCSLVIDEMAIRQQIEFDGKTYHGYVNTGCSPQNDYVEVASEAFVFMVVAIKQRWKVPVGYFFVNHLTGDQKKALVEQCFHLLQESKIVVTNLTFDGCLTNIALMQLFGCSTANLNSKIKLEIVDGCFALPDPCHMLKLVRNLFAEMGELVDEEGGIIKFLYVEQLCELQESEGLHLENKPRKQLIDFFHQKTKVKLDAQLLSRSVADCLLFCKNTLKLPAFQDVGPTAKFIYVINNTHDIFNSKDLNALSFKKPLCESNIKTIKVFSEELNSYITNLKLIDGTPVLSSNRKTGFLGIMMGLKTIINICEVYILKNEVFRYLPTYNLSLDHLKLFFESILAQGGFSNNPTCRQFTLAYRKILVNTITRGNCIPLDQIEVSNVTSATENYTLIRRVDSDIVELDCRLEEMMQ